MCYYNKRHWNIVIKEVEMPIYEYECKDCEKVFSLLQPITASEKDTECHYCGSKNVKKKFSLFSCSTTGVSNQASSASSSSGGGG